MNPVNEWASRRKNIYLGGIVVVLTIISFSIFWKFWYKAPNCNDNIKNGDETGVDCGGSCEFICRDNTVKPIIRFDPRVFEVNPNVWSTVVYVENPNANADAIRVPYKFSFYDEQNILIAEREGITILPKNKVVGIFEGEIITKDSSRPKRAIFELGEAISWKKNDLSNADISITHTPLLRLDTKPRIEATIKNNDVENVSNVELVATVFDGKDNVIAASRTFVENINKNQSVPIFFTWPRPFELGSRACEKSSNIMLLLDRSGSMSSLGQNPPEPLTTAKEAANSFVKNVGSQDVVGVLSFATNASDPVDAPLSKNLESVSDAISNIKINASSTQYTNIFEALRFGWQELISSRGIQGASNIAILLTDGVPTHPKSPTGASESEDMAYAEKMALGESYSMKRDGVSIYTIGLGTTTNESFLKKVASKEDNYFFAPSASDLESIYKKISSDICKEVPARIEITYKIFGNLI